MELPQRKSHRLKDFDYGGYYYVTICTANRIKVLCDIVGSDALVAPNTANVDIILSGLGKKATECWNNIALLNKNIEVDKFVIMPNHIHGIIIIRNTEEIEDTEIKYCYRFAFGKRLTYRASR